MARRSPAPPIPTLAELRRSSAWTWLYCNSCGHSAPMAFAPLMIRWGENASSDLVRERARCTQCGARGATLSHPSWVNSVVGVQPFPVKRTGTGYDDWSSIARMSV